MMQVRTQQIRLTLREDTLGYEIEARGTRWQTAEDWRPVLVCHGEEIPFSAAQTIRHTCFSNGVGCGIESRFSGFPAGGRIVPYAFALRAWIEQSTSCVRLEWAPLCEDGLTVDRVCWPGPLEAADPAPGYALLNACQGLLIPDDWPVELGRLPFGGRFGTADGYMPWFGQVSGRHGYLAVCETPANAGYQAEHPAGGPRTRIGVWLEPSLGRMAERRILRYSFFEDCDYNTLCKAYRTDAREQGRLIPLRCKAALLPSVERLIGCAFVHFGIKSHVEPSSDFYDAEHPEKNDSLVSFAQRAEQIGRLHALGVPKLYLHLDGWAQPGYDNAHPDYLPACREAGGWAGMRALAETVQGYGYLFGIHDQYRDYYRSAPSFDEEYACHLPQGGIPQHARWAGGPQSYLCATQAPYYLRRNFSQIRENGARLDGAYLDVFTCNEGDECDHPLHRMTRRECYDYRNRCFSYLIAQGILPSSEEVNDWAMANLVFCHYAPYDFMLRRPGAPRYGLPVPLFNLVYHECVIIPWMMEETPGEDYMLYALLNGGAPYLVREGAYPDQDGAFGTGGEARLEHAVRRCRIVTALQERVAHCELVRHDLLRPDGSRQRSVFSDGTSVEVDFTDGSWQITPPLS